MKRPPRPGFLLVATRELRWIWHDKVAFFLVTAFPLIAFAWLSFTFSSAVIRDLNTVIVDADHTATSAAYVSSIDAAPGVTVSRRASDLTAAMRAIRSGDAIAAVYIPANFERDVSAGRRPQVSVFYNEQYSTPGNAAQKSLNDAVQGAILATKPLSQLKPAPRGTLVVEPYVLTNPALNYAQFLLRSLLPVVLHAVVALATAYSVGSEFSRRSFRAWLRVSGGSALTALTGKSAPLLAIFLLQMTVITLIVHGWFAVPFRGDAAITILAACLMIVAYQALATLLLLLARQLAAGISAVSIIVSPSFGFVGVGFPILGMSAFAQFWSAILPLRWYIQILFDQGARGAPVASSALAFTALTALALLFGILGWLRLRNIKAAPISPPKPSLMPTGRGNLGTIFIAEIRRALSDRGVVSLMILAPVIYGVFYPQPYLGQTLRDVPIAVVDQDRTETSRALVMTLDADHLTRVALEADSLLDAQRALFDRKVFGIVEIPANAERQILKGNRSRVAIYVDSAYLLLYSQTFQGIAESVGTVNASFALRGAREEGIAKSALASASPVEILPVPLFNPTGGYLSYIVPAAFVLILQQTLLLGAATLGATVFERGGNSARLARGTPVAVLGQGLAHLVIALPGLFLYLGILPWFYGFAALGNLPDLAIFAATFVLAVSFLGQAAGQWLKWPEAPLLLFLGTSIPQLFLVGISWPEEAIPTFLRYAGNIFPSEAGIDGLVRINQMGASLSEVFQDWVVVLTIAGVYFLCAISRSELAAWRSSRGR